MGRFFWGAALVGTCGFFFGGGEAGGPFGPDGFFAAVEPLETGFFWEALEALETPSLDFPAGLGADFGDGGDFFCFGAPADAPALSFGFDLVFAEAILSSPLVKVIFYCILCINHFV